MRVSLIPSWKGRKDNFNGCMVCICDNEFFLIRHVLMVIHKPVDSDISNCLLFVVAACTATAAV